MSTALPFPHMLLTLSRRAGQSRADLFATLLMRLFAVLVFAVASATSLRAQPASATPLVVETASPQATLRSFLAHRDAVEALFRTTARLSERELIEQADQLIDQMARHLDLSRVAPSSRRKAGSEAVARLVDILDRVPLPPPSSIPDTTAVSEAGKPSSWTVPGTEIRILRVLTGERAGEFLFSADTVERLAESYTALKHLPRSRRDRTSDWTTSQLQGHGWLIPRTFVAQLPASLKAPVADNPVWKLLATVIIVAVIGVLVVAVRRNRRARVSRTGLAIGEPMLFGSLVWLGWYLLIEHVSLTGGIAEAVDLFGTAALYISGAWCAWLASALAVEYVLARPAIAEESLDAHLLRLLGKVAGIISSVSILAFGAQQVGLPILGLLAGVGVGGLAVALAAQHSIENLIAGLNLYVDRPIRVGDWCRCGQIEGAVEQIGLRSTRIRGLDRTLTSIPNSDVAKAQLVNFTLRDQFLFRHVIDLRFETSADRLRAFTTASLAYLQTHPRVRSDAQPPRVHVVEFAAWSIKVELFAYVDAQRLPDFLPIQEELLHHIRQIIQQTGAEFAFPSQTSYLVRVSETR